MGVTLTIFILLGTIFCDKNRSKIYFGGVTNSPKQLLITLALMSSVYLSMFLSLDSKFLWEVVVYHFCFLNDFFYYSPGFLYIIFILHYLFWNLIFYRFAFNCFKYIFIFFIPCFVFWSFIFQNLFVYNEKTMEKYSSCGIHKGKYHNDSYLLLLGKKELQSFEISYE